jgi:hypothetical protein
MNRLALAALAALLLTTGPILASADGPSTTHISLSDLWTTSAGDSMLIEVNGKLRIVSRDGAVVDSGSVEVLLWQPTDSRDSLHYVHALALAVTLHDTVSVVPGYFWAGEGSPCHLNLLLGPNKFGQTLRRRFLLERCSELSLRGEQP